MIGTQTQPIGYSIFNRRKTKNGYKRLQNPWHLRGQDSPQSLSKIFPPLSPTLLLLYSHFSTMQCITDSVMHMGFVTSLPFLFYPSQAIRLAFILGTPFKPSLYPFPSPASLILLDPTPFLILPLL